MDKKLKQLFDYQNFVNDKELDEAVNLPVDLTKIKDEKNITLKDSSIVNSALKKYRRSIWALSSSAAAAAVFVLIGITRIINSSAEPVAGDAGSIFSSTGAWPAVAIVILLLGIAAAVVLFIKDKNNKR